MVPQNHKKEKKANKTPGGQGWCLMRLGVNFEYMILIQGSMC